MRTKMKKKKKKRRKTYETYTLYFQVIRLTKKLLISESKERGYTRFFYKYADDVSPSS